MRAEQCDLLVRQTHVQAHSFGPVGIFQSQIGKVGKHLRDILEFTRAPAITRISIKLCPSRVHTDLQFVGCGGQLMSRIGVCGSQRWHLTTCFMLYRLTFFMALCWACQRDLPQAGANDLPGVGMERLSSVSTGGPSLLLPNTPNCADEDFRWSVGALDSAQAAV
jgi:hypothetical protein